MFRRVKSLREAYVDDIPRDEKMAGFESDRKNATIHDLVEQSARNGIDLQRDDGSFPPGRNYTYDEPETPVRTTSHWLQIFTEAYEITGVEKFEDVANHAIDYLLCDDVRPSGFTYYCRKAKSKDKCNGLVGQAASIRALSRASVVFDRQDAREIAEKVFQIHPFCAGLGLWERVEIDGRTLSFDRTLNHQLIFAAASAELVPDLETAESHIEQFLNKLRTNMHLHSNGLIKHYVRPPLPAVLRSISRAPRRYDMLINEVAFHYYSYSEERRKKERGYQTVNLSALSRLQSTFPDHDFWESEELSKALRFLRDNENELISGVAIKHGNPLQGVSIAKIRHRLENESIKDLQDLISADICLEADSSVFELDGIDENTQVALVSALTDLPNIEIQ